MRVIRPLNELGDRHPGLGLGLEARSVGQLAFERGEEALYGNVSRGKRKKEKVEKDPTEVTEVPPPAVSKELKRRWSYFIRKVYETDPLICPKCHGEMRIISFIGQPEVIKKILQHLSL